MSVLTAPVQTFPWHHRNKCAHNGSWGSWGYDEASGLPFRTCETGGCQQWGRWCPQCAGNGEVCGPRDEYGNYEPAPCRRCEGTGRAT